MSRSSHHHHQQRQQQKLQLQQQHQHPQQHQHQQQQQQLLLAQQQQQIAADNEAAAAAAEIFDLFCVATTMRQILGLHRSMCDVLGLRPAPLNEFYPKVKAKVRSWKAQALWKKFDARAAHRAYAKGTASTGTRVLVIGAGPCGLRTAIEAQLLGAKVVVVEKRDRISRNNVLHLWPFVITDLRNLGAKKFYGKFCAGSIDHISIRQLQCILLKVALLLGVEIHESVSFERTLEPSGDGCGWRASVTPVDHAVSHYEFDVLIGADGKRNTLEGFRRKEFRGKLAIAITANFINKKTEAEAKVEEISGVAFIFNQSFFKELYHTTGIDLENIVYYKDETHYFVMTAKKHSLIDKGVIIQDFADPAELLSPINVNKEKLLDYAREAADFSTKYQMPNLEFAVNHYGKPDVAMFDFTSMFAAETSCRVIVRKGYRLLQCLVGDSLLEPFWPTGSGCARGFLSSMDAAYALKLWSNVHNSTLGVLAQRESIYRLLNQTTPENLQRDIGSYTVDPATRYPNLNRSSVNVWQVKHLIDTDDKSILEQTYMDTNALQPTQIDAPVRRKRRSGDTMPLSAVLLRWICAQLHTYEFTKDLKEVDDVFTNGKVLCALINRYRPDLVDFNEVKDKSSIECNELAFRILDKELNIPRVMSGKDSVQQLSSIESKIWLNYLEQICEVFRGEIPHIKHPKMDFTELREKYRINISRAQPDFSKLLQISTKQKQAKTTPMQDMVDVPQTVQRRSVLDEEKLKRQRKYDLLASGTAAGAATATGGNASGNAQQQAQVETPRRAKKRRSAEKATNIEERQIRLQEIEANRQDRLSRRRQQRYQQTQNFYKSLHMLQANTLLRESDESSAFEDYSIFLYRQQAPEFNDRVKDLERKLLYPDRERTDIPSAVPRGAGNADEQFTDRIKSMEERMILRNPQGNDKKPKDLMRAIGKIDSNDWNVREIEKKIEQSKRTEIHGPQGREKVPKWSKEQFLARQTKMSKPNRQNSNEEKYKEIDQTIKNLDRQLKEGNVLEVGERGRNKVASIAGNFVKKDDNNTSDEKNQPPTVVPKANSKVALNFKKQAASEKCHFCKQTVYLMEKLQTEGLTLHRSCLKCHHCHNNLRLGGYAFDRDDPTGRFYCTQHFRLPAKPQPTVVRKPGQRKPTQQQQQAAAAAAAVAAANVNAEPKTPDTKLRGHADSVAQLESLDRGQTPERIEFENTDAMSEPSEEHIIDEHEWSGRNFLPESNNDSESELTSSDESDSDSDSDMFEEANDSPLGAQTLQLATDWIGKQNYTDSDESDDFYDSSEGIADDGKDDTDGEEFKKARELRREEVRLQPLPPNLPTDTETELKAIIDNKENINSVVLTEVAAQNIVKATDMDKISENSFNSDKSFKSATSAAPSRAEMEKLEQGTDRKFSNDIEAISEKLYRLNSMVKMNKDIETLAKENLVQSDILKKLTMKEKWLADNTVGNMNALAPKSKFIENVPKDEAKVVAQSTNKAEPEPQQETNDKMPIAQTNANDLPPKSPMVVRKHSNLSRNNSLKKPADKLSPSASPLVEKKPKTASASRSNSFKSNASADSPKVKQKLGPASRTNSLNKTNSKEELANILDNVKNMEISKSDVALRKKSNVAANEKDIGKLLYSVENKFSPIPNKRMNSKLKEIETQSFSTTMDDIKSQLAMPTITTQAASVDLSKYFPKKDEKTSASATNKSQKALKEIDLAKYFPSSPVPQRRTVETVADKIKKSQTEKAIHPAATTTTPTSTTAGTLVPKTSKVAAAAPQNTSKVTAAAPQTPSKVPPKRQASANEGSQISLRDHQLDGAIDISTKKSAVTTTVIANATKKGNIKIVKKIVPKGTKAKKLTATENQKTSIIARDVSDQILDEILNEDKEMRSPSFEYKSLFKEEKSPSEDISDKIERIFEETGIDLGITKNETATDKRKKLLKTKSLGEGEFERSAKKKFQPSEPQVKEEGDKPRGVQGLLQRFESLSSVSSSKSEENAFKLRRMESTTSNLNRSRESLVSHESDGFSDLEKTMEYLKSEWRNEATNFLQKKRDKFFSDKREDETVKRKELQQSRLESSIPVQYRDSKIAKFFGIGRKSPEKKASPPKQQKKKSPEKQAVQTNKSPPKLKKANNSLEELAHIGESRQIAANAKKATENVIQTKTEEIVQPVGVTEKKDTVASPKEKRKMIKPLNVNQQSSEAELKTTSLPTTPTENKRPMVEDIRNLPKTGCDKSRSSSRRGSQASLQSRRGSDVSLTDNLNSVVAELLHDDSAKNVDQLFDNLIDQMDVAAPTAAVAPMVLSMEVVEAKKDPTSLKEEDEAVDSLRTSISKSPSVPPVTVRLRGSSEDQSIENLFSQFTDDMLVNVEFDSNDELIKITPHPTLTIPEEQGEENKDILDRVESLERDEMPVRKDNKTDKSVSISPIEATKSATNFLLKTNAEQVDEQQFPPRPVRRQKSTSSSSEPSAPIAPQRLKKKLNKICPTDMAPSVQDLLQKALINSTQMQSAQAMAAVADGTAALKFPHTIEEDESLPSSPKSSMSRKSSQDKADAKPQSPKPPPRQHADGKKSKENSLEPMPLKTQKTIGTGATDSKKDSTANVAKPLANSRPTAESNVKSKDLNGGTNVKPKAVDVPKVVTPTKAQSKERSLEWDMEKLPASPMPPRRFMVKDHAMPSPLSETTPKLRDVSPTTSIQILNDLPPTNEVDSDVAAQRRLIEEFEMERRKDLIKRDKNYMETQKPLVEAVASTNSDRDSNPSMKGTPLATPQRRESPRSSRRSTQDNSNRCGTPPMTKRLEIPSSSSEAKLTPESSRRGSLSSFAFIELQEQNGPTEAPMPRKLQLPVLAHKQDTDETHMNGDDVIFQNRPWPKQHVDGEDAEVNLKQADEREESLVRSPSHSPLAEVFRNRHWPDGKTVFFREQTRAESCDDFDERLSHNKRRLRSQSPSTFARHPYSRATTLEPGEGKVSSKSVCDLSKNAPRANSPANATASHISMQSLPVTRSSRSSADTEPYASHLSAYAMDRPARPALKPISVEMDASTRLLLDRSKQLHELKSDFVNDRVVERNPYMKDVIRDEQLGRIGSSGGRHDASTTMDFDYRPRSTYASSSALNSKPKTRFPTSRALGRNYQDYDYDDTPLTAYTDYAGGSSGRRAYGTGGISSNISSTLPSTYYPTSAYSSSSALTSPLGRSTHLSSDYMRRSPAATTKTSTSTFRDPRRYNHYRY